MPATTITASELSTLLRDEPKLTLLDVRLPEDYSAAHLPKALNQCVFEVGFMQGLDEKGLSKDDPVCVYGHDGDSHESRMAAEKLDRAGFRRIYDYRGGLEAWKTDGHSVDESPVAASKSSPPLEGRVALDLQESSVTWIGRNLLNRHWGTVPLKSGWVEFHNARPISGEVLLDMRRLTSADLAGSDLHDVLIHHLESDDFFDVERHPEARFAFDQVELCSDLPGCTNIKLEGALTLRGVTKPLVIEASAGFTPEGKAALQSTFHIDRTDWGVLYGSGKFFRNLAGHLVNDHIELQLRIVTADAVLQ